MIGANFRQCAGFVVWRGIGEGSAGDPGHAVHGDLPAGAVRQETIGQAGRMRGHRQLLDDGAGLRKFERLDQVEVLGEVGRGGHLPRDVAADNQVAWQAAIQRRLFIVRGEGHRRMRRPVAGHAGDAERVAGVGFRGLPIREVHLPLGDFHRGRHGRHGQGRQRHHRGDRRAVLDLRVRQRAGVLNGAAVGTQFGAGLEHIVDAEQRPHAGGEMRVEMAVEDGIARRQILIAAAGIDQLQ